MYCLLKSQLKKIARCLAKMKLKYVCGTIGLIILLDVYGVFTHIFEVSYTDDFAYPYQGDIGPFVEALRRNKKPEVEPINVYNYTFLRNPQNKCDDPGFRTLRIVFLVKSATEHFDRRDVIRNSWGYGNRFFDVPTRLIFLLGTKPGDEEFDHRLNAESERHKDILQADFVDAYYNNTIKTMMGFRWAVDFCKNAKFYMFVDDDIYVSVRNVLRFLRNPASYPDYLQDPGRMAVRKREIKDSDLDARDNHFQSDENGESAKFSRNKVGEMQARGEISSTRNNTLALGVSETMTNFQSVSEDMGKDSESWSNRVETAESVGTRIERKKRQVFDFELPDDVRLYAGNVFPSSSPARHKISRWYISLKEYPYDLWPPYITAGAYILSKEALLDMYYASFYTKHFRFDDIFLGIVAKKADIEIFHCDEFHFYKKEYTKHNYKYVITSHGYEDPRELRSVWQEQKSLGNA